MSGLMVLPAVLLAWPLTILGMLYRADRFGVFLANFCTAMSASFGTPRARIFRLLIPLHLLFAGGFAIMLLAAANRVGAQPVVTVPGAPLVPVYVALGLLVLLMVLLLVVSGTGRPRLLVPAPARGQSLAEIEVWLAERAGRRSFGGQTRSG